MSEKLDSITGIHVVGTAIDPFVGRKKILDLQPDVLLLDIEMPRMDGLTFLKTIMAHYPLPVVILSSLVSNGSKTYFRALDLGALEVISKPDSAHSLSIDSQIGLIAEKIKQAAQTNMDARRVVSKAMTTKKFWINCIL